VRPPPLILPKDACLLFTDLSVALHASVDFNEALSAFHGPTLLAQSAYVASCVSHILASAYTHLPPDQRPTSVVLLGHSMGGIVAQHAVTRLPDPTTVRTVVTLSTPHQQAPVTTDSSLAQAYSDIATFFSPANALDRQHPACEHLLVSLCGGSPDPTLAADACALPEATYGPLGALGVFTSGLIGAWTGVDHEAMVWCHQVRWRVARLLLELGGRDGWRLSAPREDRRRVSAEWLIGAGPPSESRGEPLAPNDWIRLEAEQSAGRFIVPSTAAGSKKTIALFPLPAAGEPATFRLITTFAIASIGPEDASAAHLLRCSSPTDMATCHPLALKTLKLLPPSPVGGGPFAVGEGVDEKDGLVWAEADVVGDGGWAAVAIDKGAGWGLGEVVSTAEPDVARRGTFGWSLSPAHSARDSG
jgi:glycosylphosphatidylinositol deacylase